LLHRNKQAQRKKQAERKKQPQAQRKKQAERKKQPQRKKQAQVELVPRLKKLSHDRHQVQSTTIEIKLKYLALHRRPYEGAYATKPRQRRQGYAHGTARGRRSRRDIILEKTRNGLQRGTTIIAT
jgi:hypothetical protein